MASSKPEAKDANRIPDFQAVFAQVVAARADCQDPAVRDAFARVPRHEFMGSGPWYFTETGYASQSDDPALLYQDVAIGLAPHRGITTGLPSLHARCIAACGLRTGECVIHVGAGAGYYTAILAELVGATGQVIGFEVDEDLAARARENLRMWPWAHVQSTSGVSHGQFDSDLIYVSAGVEQLPQAWLAGLRPGGRLLVPLVPAGHEGGMLLVRTTGSSVVLCAEFVCRARFVPCVGTQDEAARSQLAEAFYTTNYKSVRSLRLRGQVPDESAWFAGDGWWLSTKTPDIDAGTCAV